MEADDIGMLLSEDRAASSKRIHGLHSRLRMGCVGVSPLKITQKGSIFPDNQFFSRSHLSEPTEAPSAQVQTQTAISDSVGLLVDVIAQKTGIYAASGEHSHLLRSSAFAIGPSSTDQQSEHTPHSSVGHSLPSDAQHNIYLDQAEQARIGGKIGRASAIVPSHLESYSPERTDQSLRAKPARTATDAADASAIIGSLCFGVGGRGG
ncbi:hypothetical protein PaG_04868 [Moesziomyces aphidis]|uniref:Uncharacterized protein n=1 Tax=Moesziomyces aphidis TaxID=84754 RepID=W3VJF8_MOEAP|nr:hypothetical protein PaG_04868 [Moesziomyces aphidis]